MRNEALTHAGSALPAALVVVVRICAGLNPMHQRHLDVPFLATLRCQGCRRAGVVIEYLAAGAVSLRCPACRYEWKLTDTANPKREPRAPSRKRLKG